MILAPKGVKEDPASSLPFRGTWEGKNPGDTVRLYRLELEGGRARIVEISCNRPIYFTGRMLTFDEVIWPTGTVLKVTIEAPRVTMKKLPVDLILFVDEHKPKGT
jgi:hypothetical protein